MGGLFRAVAADSHAAPPSRSSVRLIQHQQGTRRPFAGLNVRKILRADQVRHGPGDRQKQRIAALPAPKLTPGDTGGHFRIFSALALNDLTILLVAIEDSIQRCKLSQNVRSKRPAFVLSNKAAKPFAQGACLPGDSVQLTGSGTPTHGGWGVDPWSVAMARKE